MTAEQISEYFGTKNPTVSNKAREIKDMFDMWHFSPEFSTQRMAESNPFSQMVMVDGFIMPINTLPEMVEGEITEELNLWEYTAFVNELDQRLAEYESGKMKGSTWAEVKAKARALKLR